MSTTQRSQKAVSPVAPFRTEREPPEHGGAAYRVCTACGVECVTGTDWKHVTHDAGCPHA